MDDGTSFAKVAETLEQVSSTTSKILKVKHLAELLRILRPEEVGPVVRMVLGRPLRGEKKDMLQIGYSTLLEVILDISGSEQKELHRLYLEHGDLGEVCFHLFERKKEVPLFEKSLTVKSVTNSFENISKVSGKGSKGTKERYLKSLFLNAKPIEAKYLVKMLTGEMRTGMVEGLVEEAVSNAFGIDREEARRLHTILGDVAILAEKAARGELKSVRLCQFTPCSFMLAETAKDAHHVVEHFGKEVYAEFKYDGIRAQIHKLNNEVRIYSRRLEDVTEFFPEVRERAEKSVHNFIIDGEIVPFRDSKPLSFQWLQKRLRRLSGLAEIMKDVPVEYFAFDILLFNDKETYMLPLKERVSILERAIEGTGLKLAKREKVREEGEIERLFELSKSLGYEGLVLKDPDTPYSLGKRGADWLKLKKELDTIDAVIVAAEYGHGKRAGLLSDYTFAVRSKNGFVVVGKAYSGLTDREIEEMTERLNQITTEDLGFIKKVKPEIVLEIAFDSVQKSNRHDSGFALRFPRIKRIRYDKTAEQADTIDKVRQIYYLQGQRDK